jgi:DNA-3-methyladenine glycosylase I
MMEYHDTEWGVPVHDDRLLFEYLLLDGAQAGLSWLTVLNKRENYRAAFDNFDPVKVARYTGRDVKRLSADAGIIRNRLKIYSAITNAVSFLEVVKEYGSFDAFIWPLAGSRPTGFVIRTEGDIPAKTVESDGMSKALKGRGFKFVGSTICYAFMQAAGMVNDHQLDCFRHSEV